MWLTERGLTRSRDIHEGESEQPIIRPETISLATLHRSPTPIMSYRRPPSQPWSISILIESFI